MYFEKKYFEIKNMSANIVFENSPKFWINDPCVLLDNPQFFPTDNMSLEEKLNAVTRSVIVVSGVMLMMKYKYWGMFLVMSLIIIVGVYYSKKQRNAEGFSVTPTYIGTDFQQTIVAPTYAEEWQIPPPAYDLYTQVPYPDTFEEPLKPQSYPYGQYLTRTNLLPSDEYYTHMGCGGARTAREYINSTYLRHDLANRENISRIYKKKLNRRFRHNTQDTFSPFQSY